MRHQVRVAALPKALEIQITSSSSTLNCHQIKDNRIQEILDLEDWWVCNNSKLMTHLILPPPTYSPIFFSYQMLVFAVKRKLEYEHNK